MEQHAHPVLPNVGSSCRYLGKTTICLTPPAFLVIEQKESGCLRRPRIELGPRAWELHEEISFGQWQTSRWEITYARILPLNYRRQYAHFEHINPTFVLVKFIYNIFADC